MKKMIFFISFLVVVTVTISAQGFYFDIGLGLGKAWTKVDGNDIADELKSAGADVSETAVDLGLKAGYGPFGKIPIYLVGESSAIGHRIYDDDNYIQFNSYLIGPGILFYPIPFFQLGFSLGYSYVANVTDIPGYKMRSSKEGFAWNVSAAVDLGSGNHGCLIGIRYFSAENKIKTTNVKQNSSLISIFVKYAYRRKVSS